MNRAVATALLLSLVSLGSSVAASPSAAAGTDFEKFQKSLAKVTATITKSQGLFCVCKNNSVNNDRAGVLTEIPITQISGGVGVLLLCNVLQFDSGGASNGGFSCTPWELLPK